MIFLKAYSHYHLYIVRIVIVSLCGSDGLKDDVGKVAEVCHVYATSNVVGPVSLPLPLALQPLTLIRALPDVPPLVDGGLAVHVRSLRNMELHRVSSV